MHRSGKAPCILVGCRLHRFMVKANPGLCYERLLGHHLVMQDAMLEATSRTSAAVLKTRKELRRTCQQVQVGKVLRTSGRDFFKRFSVV